MDSLSPPSPDQDDLAGELSRIEAALSNGEGGERTKLHFQAAQLLLLSEDREDRERAAAHLRACFTLDPDNLDTYLSLTQFLLGAGDLAGAAELFRQRAARETDAWPRGSLLLRAAELAARAGEVEQALDALRALDQADGQHLRNQRMGILRALLSRIEEGDATGAEGARDALRLLLPLARGEEALQYALALAERCQRQGDAASAHDARLAALAVHPAWPDALEPALAHIEARGTDQQWVDLITRAARSAEHPADAAALWRRLAEMEEDRRKNPRAAADAWWEAYRVHAGPLDALNLKRLFADLDDWAAYLEVLRHEAFLCSEVTNKMRVLREMATFQQQVQKDDLAAAWTLGSLLQLAPSDEAALAARVEIFSRLSQPDAEASALLRFAGRCSPGPARESLLRRLILIEWQRYTRPERLLHILQQLDPEDRENRRFLREMLQREDPGLDGPALIEVSLCYLQMPPADPEETEALCTFALAAAQRCERWERPELAARCYERLLKLAPDHAEARERLARIAPSRPWSDPTVQELERQAARKERDDPHGAARLQLRAAQIVLSTSQEGGAESRAARLLRRAVALCPPDAGETLQALEETLRQTRMHSELAQVLETLSSTEKQPAMRKGILRELGRIYRDSLDRPDLARETLQQAVALDPEDLDLALELRRLLRQQGRDQDLAQLLSGLQARTTGPQRLRIIEELASLLACELDDTSAALRYYEELLLHVPDHHEALSFCRTQYEQRGDHEALVRLLGLAAAAAEAAETKAALCEEAARIAELELDDVQLATDYWQQAARATPEDPLLRRELRDHLERTGRHGELITELIAELARSLDPGARVPLYQELARVAWRQQKNDRAAIGYLLAALQLAPDNNELTEQLVEIYEQRGHWRDLARMLRRLAERETVKERRGQLLRRAARVLMIRLGRDAEAEEICRQVLEVLPGDRETATLLGEILGKQSRWEEKITLLHEQIAAESDPSELSRLHLEVGRILLDRLDSPQPAAAHFEVALNLGGLGGQVLALLRRIHEARKRWDLLVEIMERRGASESLPARERANALCEVGRISEEQLGDPQRAKEAYERALVLEPASLASLSGLRRLAEHRQEWRTMIQLAHHELELTQEPGERSMLLLEVARILHGHLEQTDEAVAALREVTVLDPGNNQATEQLAIILFDKEEYEEAERHLRRVVRSSLEVSTLHEHYYRLAFIAQRSGRDEEAFSLYVRSFTREPLFLPTLNRLLDLCFARRQWDNTKRIAQTILDSYADQKSSEELADLQVRVALCLLHEAQRVAGAKMLKTLALGPEGVPVTSEEAWLEVAGPWAATPLEPTLLKQLDPATLRIVTQKAKQALSHVPDHAGAHQLLAALALHQQEWEQGLRHLEAAAASSRLTPEQQAALLVCAGEVAHRKLHALSRAAHYLHRAVGLIPASAGPRRRLEAVELALAVQRGEPPPVRPRGGPAVSPPPTPQERPLSEARRRKKPITQPIRSGLLQGPVSQPGAPVSPTGPQIPVRPPPLPDLDDEED